MAQLKYSQIIGSSMHVMNYTRPNIAHAVGRLSRYTSSPNAQHQKVLNRVLRYLNGTMFYSIHYTIYLAVLEGYSDANYIADLENSKSTIGYVFTLGRVAIA